MRRIFGALVITIVIAPGPLPVRAQDQPTRTCFGLVPTITGTSDNDRLMGTPGPDVIVSGYGHDVVWGRGGDDVICGGIFDDYLIGGDGNDRLSGDPGDDTLSGGIGDDELRDGSIGFAGEGNDVLEDVSHAIPGPGDDVVTHDRFGLVSFRYAPGPVTVSLRTGIATGEGTDTLVETQSVYGSDHDDVIEGDDRLNYLYGREGNDHITGLDWWDWIDGGLGDDYLDGGSGEINNTDVVSVGDSRTGAEVSLLTGTSIGPGEDTIVGFEHIWGSAFDDVLEGTASGEILVGLDGNDEVAGLEGDDRIHHAESGSAGPGMDECVSYRVHHVENCEHSEIRFPPSGARVVYPDHFDVIPAPSFDRVEAEPVQGRDVIRKVQVALSMNNENGCRYWSPSRLRLVARACHRPIWSKVVEVNGTLPPGRYSAHARALVDTGWGSDATSVTFFLE